jgi:hypothetical protein
VIFVFVGIVLVMVQGISSASGRRFGERKLINAGAGFAGGWLDPEAITPAHLYRGDTPRLCRWLTQNESASAD